MRLGDFQIVIPGAVIGRGQSVYLGLILFDRLLQLRDFLRKFQSFAGGGEALCAGLAQRRGKRLVHLVIGEAFCFVCVLLFFFAHGERCERLRNLPGMQVNDGRLLGTRLRLLPFEEGKVGHRISRGPGKYKAKHQQARENEKRNKPAPAEHALRCHVILFLETGQVTFHGPFWQLPKVAR